MIKEIIETRLRPFVQEDGGDIKYLDFDEDKGLVTIEMKGSCAGCPSSAVTLKSGIESMLKHYVQEVNTVEAVDFNNGE
jgi:Fe-S cluster biogenesis protein NfuA